MTKGHQYDLEELKKVEKKQKERFEEKYGQENKMGDRLEEDLWKRGMRSWEHKVNAALYEFKKINKEGFENFMFFGLKNNPVGAGEGGEGEDEEREILRYIEREKQKQREK